jgi:hypothetical protein
MDTDSSSDNKTSCETEQVQLSVSYFVASNKYGKFMKRSWIAAIAGMSDARVTPLKTEKG